MINLNKSKLISPIILLISIAVLGSLTLFKNIEKSKFNGDESGWISSGYYYSTLLLEGDFEWQRWKCLPQCGPWSSLYNPHLGQWVIGIPLKILAAKGEKEFYSFYVFEKSQKKIKKKEIFHHSLFYRLPEAYLQ